MDHEESADDDFQSSPLNGLGLEKSCSEGCGVVTSIYGNGHELRIMISRGCEQRGGYEEAIQVLLLRFGQRLNQSESVCQQYGKDESSHPSIPPDAVIKPASTEEVIEIIKICAHHHTPIIPYGVGTSLEGHIAALEGGICVDLSAMNQIIAVHQDDLDVVVEPGVTRRQLDRHLRDTGLFFPVDPGADATFGGMVATRASGTNAVRYGTMRENTLGLVVVLADGRVIRTAHRARKSAAGYDLTRLFVGSEGTLGIITEITLKLYGVPEVISSAVCAFPSLESAVNTAIVTIQSGIPVARIELLDDKQLEAVNQYSGLNYEVAPTLFLEFHGSQRAVDEQIESFQGIVKEQGGSGFKWASSSEERSSLWRARHDAAYAAKALKPGAAIWATDVCVPISRLAECIAETKRDIEESALLAPIVGHVGDGNFHLVLLADPDDPDEVGRAEKLHQRMVMRALKMEGTCTGEHGVGYGKIDFLQAEHGEGTEVMKTIKQALDPQNLMNPGKIVRVGE